MILVCIMENLTISQLFAQPHKLHLLTLCNRAPVCPVGSQDCVKQLVVNSDYCIFQNRNCNFDRQICSQFLQCTLYSNCPQGGAVVILCIRMWNWYVGGAYTLQCDLVLNIQFLLYMWQLALPYLTSNDGDSYSWSQYTTTCSFRKSYWWILQDWWLDPKASSFSLSKS